MAKRTVSIGTMLEQCHGLEDTQDLSDWENDFVKDNYERYVKSGKKTSWMSERQLEHLCNIWDKHFA